MPHFFSSRRKFLGATAGGVVVSSSLTCVDTTLAADAQSERVANPISGDFIAHSSYRVTGNAVPMGEAAGLAAAVSIAKNVMPHELTWQQIRQVTV